MDRKFNPRGWDVGIFAEDKHGNEILVCPRQPWTAYKLPEKSCGHDWVFLNDPEPPPDDGVGRHVDGRAYCRRRGCKATATFRDGVIESYDLHVIRDR